MVIIGSNFTKTMGRTTATETFNTKAASVFHRFEKARYWDVVTLAVGIINPSTFFPQSSVASLTTSDDDDHKR